MNAESQFPHLSYMLGGAETIHRKDERGTTPFLVLRDVSTVTVYAYDEHTQLRTITSRLG